MQRWCNLEAKLKPSNSHRTHYIFYWGKKKKKRCIMHCDSLFNESGSILRISESILSLVFNQIHNDVVCFGNICTLLAFNCSHTYTTGTIHKIIIHKVWEGWIELQRHSQCTGCTVGDACFTFEECGLAHRYFSYKFSTK